MIILGFAIFYHSNYDNYGINDRDVCEYNIYFDPMRNDYRTLQETVSGFDRRVNLLWEGPLDKDKVLLLDKLAKSLYVRIKAEHLPQVQFLKDNGIKFFLDFSLMVDSYIMLHWVIDSLKPNEIYIGDDLCYNLDNVYSLCCNNNIGLRLVVNRIPTLSPVIGLDKTSPIFRPEDIDLLSIYFDTFELDLSDEREPFNEYLALWDRLPILYKRYFVDKHWDSYLNYLNKDILIKFDNNIPLDFASYKTTCMHRCTMLSNSLCSKCRRYIKEDDAVENI